MSWQQDVLEVGNVSKQNEKKEIKKKKKTTGPYEDRTHDLRVISTAL
jgi:hypothetical protein